MNHVSSAVLHNGQVIPIQVESVLHRRALPQLIITGLPRGTVLESRERLLSTLRSIGVRLPQGRLVINLRPVQVPKHTSLLDVPMLIAVLIVLGKIPESSRIFALGELSLDGTVIEHPEVFRLIQALEQVSSTCDQVIVPQGSSFLSLLPPAWKNTVFPIQHARSLLELHNYKSQTEVRDQNRKAAPVPTQNQEFLELEWEWIPKQVIESLALSLAGYHHILLFGAPGLGKSHMQHVVEALWPPDLLPVLYERAQIQSQCGKDQLGLHVQVVPSNVTLAQLRGSRSKKNDLGLIQRSQYGALWCEELPLWSKSCLEELRPLMECTDTEPCTAVTRCIATLNPCPCGYAGESSCHCNAGQVTRYQQRVPYALLDRFSISLRYRVPQYQEDQATEDLVNTYRTGIEQAWHRQTERANGGCKQWNQWYGWLEGMDSAEDLPDTWARQLQRWSPRRRVIWWRVCRTLADMSELGKVSEEHRQKAYILTRPVLSWAKERT